MTLHLQSFAVRDVEDSARFPFSVPAIRSLPRVQLESAVTFFVGENGSGKSTLLEALATAARLPAVGAEELDRDATLEAQRTLGRTLKLTWSKRAARGFFMRAEDFFGFARRMSRMRLELLERLGAIDAEYGDASEYARALAAGPVRASLAAMEKLYGTDLDARSHGESFLKLFESRLVPDGLYLMDEPEAALSPQSQLGLIALIADAVSRNCQFVIATHSPILLAYPGASILSFDEAPPRMVQFGELEHVTLTRDFLNDPATYLRRLMPQDDE